MSSFRPKNQRKYCKDFCPESFQSFLGASLLMRLLTKSPGNPKKLPGSPQEATKNFRADILTIFSLLYWSKRWHQKDISKLTDLYRWLQRNEVGMLPSKINYLHQRALRGEKWTKRCHSPITAWKIFFSFLLGIRKWDLQGHFFNSLGHIKSCPHCVRTGTIFLIARLARSDPRNHLVISSAKTFHVPFTQF